MTNVAYKKNHCLKTYFREDTYDDTLYSFTKICIISTKAGLC